jgi:hypothetical protein
MLYYVHSAGRAGPLPTLDALLGTPHAARARLVVQAKEAKAYAAAYPNVRTIVLPPSIKSLSPTRQWLLENSDSRKFILFDDDLAFAKRRIDDPTKFESTRPGRLKHMLDLLDRTLDKFAHVGVLAREGGNRITAPHVDVIRMMRVLGYDRDRVLATGARFDRLPTKQDFDMTLQLLRAGLPNRVIASYVQNQAGSNTAGGCSAYRTSEMMDKSAHDLAALHPGFVKVVQKNTKTSWGGGTRTDVTIAWKKAYASSK